MNRFLAVTCSTLVFAGLAACYIQEKPPANGTAGQPAPTPATATPAPTAGTATPAPTDTAAPPGTVAVPGPGTVTPPPIGTGGMPGLPPPGGGFTFPGVCVPIGSWAKQLDNGVPATGTVDIGTPVIFNQFPVNDGVVIAGAPLGSLKGTGAMTSTNDLSVDVSNAGYVISYTCKFSGANCNVGTCTVTKGGLSGFKLVKK
jgi:hypothetical protein